LVREDASLLLLDLVRGGVTLLLLDLIRDGVSLLLLLDDFFPLIFIFLLTILGSIW